MTARMFPLLLLAAALVTPLVTAGSYEEPSGDTSTTLLLGTPSPVACEDRSVDIVGLDVDTSAGTLTLRVTMDGLADAPATCGGETVSVAPVRRVAVDAIPWAHASAPRFGIDSPRGCATLRWADGAESACFGATSWTGDVFSWSGPQSGEIGTSRGARAYDLAGAPDFYLQATSEMAGGAVRVFDRAHFPEVTIG